MAKNVKNKTTLRKLSDWLYARSGATLLLMVPPLAGTVFAAFYVNMVHGLLPIAVAVTGLGIAALPLLGLVVETILNKYVGVSPGVHDFENYESDSSDINPASGLPMFGDLDAHGNPFGIDD